jgi:glutamine amidotransferase-like uncharacterized protein
VNTAGAVVSTTNNIPKGIWLINCNLVWGSSILAPARIDFKVGTSSAGAITVMTIVAVSSTSTYYNGSCIVVNTNDTNDFFLVIRTTGTDTSYWNSAAQVVYTRIA